MTKAMAWTEEEVTYLKEHAGKKSYAEIAKDLNRTEKSVGMKALRLGIQGKTRRYTEEEDELIRQYAGSHTLQWIAGRLRRPVEGVRIRMVELGVANMHMEAGSYSASELASIVGVSHETVRRWIQEKGLPAIKKARNTKVKREYMRYHIFPEDFWAWAEKHKNLVDFNKIELDSLPPEPEWVMEERRKQFYKIRPKKWTPEEDKQLLYFFYEQAKTQKEIAELMGRTENSIERRLYRLRQQQRR